MVPITQEHSLAIHVNLDIIIVKVNSNCKWNNVDVNSIQKKKNQQIMKLKRCLSVLT